MTGSAGRPTRPATVLSTTDAPSSRLRSPLALLVLWAILAAACTGGVEVETVSPVASEPSSTTTAAAAPSTAAAPGTSTTSASTTTTARAADEVELLVASLTTEEKIGQLLMPVVYGTHATDVGESEQAANMALGGATTPATLVARQKLGGILLLGPNIVDAAQVAELSADLQTAGTASGVGLLLAVDQEGGRVNRITDGVTVFPSARSLSGDATAVRDAAATTAAELSALGINVVLAPVADLAEGAGVIGDRSYGSDPDSTATMVVASVEGLTVGGVAAAVKHWPGHGSTDVDSHRRLPVLDLEADSWRERDRVPFEAAVEQDVDIVMVGHLAIPSLDPSGDPATVSQILVGELLRDELGYQGVVMTDALDMGAVSSLDPGELAVGAVLAGVDVLLVPPDLSLARAGLERALVDGRLSEERLDRSVERILRLKSRLGLLA